MKTLELRNELKALRIPELRRKRVEVAEDLLKRRFRAAVGQAPSGMSLSTVKKQLARVETELRAKELAAVG